MSFFILLLNFAFAEAPAQIKNLSGCFEATYRFVEDGTHDLEIVGAIEEVQWEERADGSYYLQHYGIFEGQKYKHFGEHWSPAANNEWKQIIYSPSGTLRYECTAPIVFNQYKCSVKDAPKPNRDINRHDYETLDREIVLQMTSAGWTQSENNIKRDAAKNFVSNELGWIEYRRVDAVKCQ